MVTKPRSAVTISVLHTVISIPGDEMSSNDDSRRKELESAVIAELAAIDRLAFLRWAGLRGDGELIVCQADDYLAERLSKRSLVAFEALVEGTTDYESAIRSIISFHKQSLFGLAKNAIRREAKRKEREVAYVENRPQVHWDSFSDVEDILTKLRNWLTEADIQLLRFVARGNTVEEIASELKRSNNVIYKRFCRMRKKLHRNNVRRDWFV